MPSVSCKGNIKQILYGIAKRSISMSDLLHKKIRLSSFQLIILGFAGVILLGACVLMLPISSQLRQFTPFSEALFTATSAVCVTGLIVQGTGCYWSLVRG